MGIQKKALPYAVACWDSRQYTEPFVFRGSKKLVFGTLMTTKDILKIWNVVIYFDMLMWAKKENCFCDFADRRKQKNRPIRSPARECFYLLGKADDSSLFPSSQKVLNSHNGINNVADFHDVFFGLMPSLPGDYYFLGSECLFWFHWGWLEQIRYFLLINED